MMSEEDRKKVFWLLKKYSSYTAWKALGNAYAEFSAAFEYAIRHAQPGLVGSQITGWYKRILDGQIAFEKGLPLLRSGQRGVFRSVDTGFLNYAADQIVFIQKIMDPEEYVFDWMKNKETVTQAADELIRCTSGLLSICEADDVPLIAYGWNPKLHPINGPFNFPPNLPDVPRATQKTVNTGDEVPTDGIWEPGWSNSNGVAKLFVSDAANVESGCMNYLLAGSVAPKYKDDYGKPELDVGWRLIWEDHRYEGGTIPEEEKEYLAEPGSAIPSGGSLRSFPGETVSKTGLWWSPAIDGGKPRRFTQGDRLPDIATTDYGAVVWYFDPDKQ